MKTKDKKFKKSQFLKLNEFQELKAVLEPVLINKEKNEFNLFVKTPFRQYLKGQLITRKEEIEKILDSHEKNMVLKTNNK
jgi:hypothetical protein